MRQKTDLHLATKLTIAQSRSTLPGPIKITHLPMTLALAALVMIFQLPSNAAGPAPVDLKSAARFTILAGAGITTNGGGIICGDIGVSPSAGAAIDLAQAQIKGTIFAVDATGPAGAVIDAALLRTAQNDLTAAYNDAAGRTPIPSGAFLNPGASNLGGLNLVPGLYRFTTTALITGANVTLTGGPDDVWIFQIGTDLQVGSGIHVILAGGAESRNIFWQVGNSATIGTSAMFKGTILADQAIMLNAVSALDGRALAFSAGVAFNGSVAGLPMPKDPVFTHISRTSAGAVMLALRTTPHYPLALQTSLDLTPGSWTTIATDTPATELWTFIHDASLATGPKRFYRASIMQCDRGN